MYPLVGRFISPSFVKKTQKAIKMSDVIDWDEAMQQCGEDEEFLRELLDDLRSETDTQMLKIEETIRVSGCEQKCIKQTRLF